MKPLERDELLIRMDEKFKRLYGDGEDDGDIPAMRRHLKDLNSSSLKNTIRGVRNENSIRWIVRLLIAAVVIGSGATGLIQWLG